MVDAAIRAEQAYRCMVSKDPLTGEATPLDYPDLADLPDWAQGACVDGTLFITHHDDYASLWVETQYAVKGMPLYVRVGMDFILINRGGGYVAALGPCTWKFVVEG
jgi:hypothetical protein